MKKKRVKSLLSLLIVLPALLFFACPDPTEEPSGEGSGGGNTGTESITVDPVTDLSAAPGDGTVELTWTLPLTSFDKIVIVYDGKSLEITDRTQPYAYIEGLQNGTEYTFSVTVWKGSVSSKPTEIKATPEAGASATVPVIFHSNPPADSGVGATAAGQNVPIGTETALRANTFEIPLYRFEGWATAADGEKVYDDGALVTINERLELWAVWTFAPAALERVTVDLPEFVVGSSSVTVSETLEPENAWVKSVSVTVSPNNAEFVYTRDTRLLTIPSNRTDNAVDYTLTFTYTTIDDAGDDATKSYNVSVKVYPDSYVIRNGKLYKPAKTYTDFTNTSDIEMANDSSGVTKTNGLQLDVSELVADGGETTKVTFKNIKNGESGADTNGWLMELTVNYSNASNVLGIIQFAGGNGGAPWFWLLRNNYENSIGGGTAFSVGANRSGANTRYTVPSNDPFTLGYLFDGADKENNTNPVSFFFNGEYRPLELTEDQPITAPTLGDTFQLIFARETDSNGNDDGDMTIQKVVFYQPVVTAAAN